MSNVRPSALAGRWYPSDPIELKKDVSGYIEAAKIPKLNSEVVALIAPHAGFIFSGATAGHAFKAVQGNQYDLVVVLSPFHNHAPAPLLTSAYGAYQTPLGSIEIDKEIIDKLNIYLEENGGEKLEEIAQEQEHSLEIELPFLQVALAKEFKLLPIMLGSHNLDLLTILGEGLASILKDKKVLLVASTDLSHFYTQEQAEIYDREMLRQIEAFSPKEILLSQAQGKAFACGVMAVSSILTASEALGATRVRILDYRTSGEVYGDYERVVGYGAAVVLM